MIDINYRASQRGKAAADFIYKLKIVEVEAEESQFFLELVHQITITEKAEAEELLNRLPKEAS